MKKLCIIGHFGFGRMLLNGQTVKTKILAEALNDALGKGQVLQIDTHGGFKALYKLPLQALRALIICENILILPANNGLRVITPVLSFYNLFFKRKLHYAVIGGWLPEFLQKRKMLARQLKRFAGIYVETSTMKKALDGMGFENVVVLPNCKQLPILFPEQLPPLQKPYKLCTFSRVMKEKGIEDAVSAVMAVNEVLGETVYALDIYGQVDTNQIRWFEDLQKTFPEYIRYGGLVPFDQSVEVLKNYFALLFPTYYDGEGFAGTLLDAMASGVPVVASDWRYNAEIVKEGRTGTLFSARDVDALTEKLKTIVTDNEKWNAMRPACLQEAQKYLPEEAVKVLLKRIEA